MLWYPSPAEMETELDLLLEARINIPHKTNLVVAPQLMKLLWIIQMGNEADLLFTITVEIPIWLLK